MLATTPDAHASVGHDLTDAIAGAASPHYADLGTSRCYPDGHCITTVSFPIAPAEVFREKILEQRA